MNGEAAAGKMKYFLLSLFLTGLSLGGYLLAADITYRLGFPLDDAWIHQTYARNLAETGEWAFIPGVPSTGSTSPGWTFLLALGHLLRIPPLTWSNFIGWLIFIGLVIAGATCYTRCIDRRDSSWIWAGLILALEWHLVWAAGSGMETLIFTLFVVVGMILTFDLRLGRGESKKFDWKTWLGLGALTGGAIWVRPDGLTLLGVFGLVWLTYPGDWRAKAVSAGEFSAGFLLLFLPYLGFNYLLAGEIWPNTFYAKQAEYTVLQQTPFWVRFLEQSFLPFVGVEVVLLPGFVWQIIQSVRFSRWVQLVWGIWILGYLGLYAWRLPVTYQHGRYVMPVIPIIILLGLPGIDELGGRVSGSSAGRILMKSWKLTMAGVLVGFWFLGARAYSVDVAIIESEMVEAARWIEANTESDALIAAHDIGALGYFSKRKLIDLAGLVSPEVIPIMRNEAALKDYLDSRRADYLMTFPGWYPDLIREARLLYSTGGKFGPAQGGENMVIYRWEGR